MTKVGRERGWPAMTRSRFEPQVGPKGALLVGSPEEVAVKILRHAEALGGISRVTFQLDSAELPHKTLMQTIGLIGDRVRPLLHSLSMQGNSEPDKAWLEPHNPTDDENKVHR